MKKALIFSGILIGVFFTAVFIILIVDIANDVKYEVIEEEKHPKTVYLKVNVEELNKDKINTIADEVENKYKDEDLEVVFLYIHEKGEIKALVNIPYDEMGMVRAGTDNLEYKIKYK